MKYKLLFILSLIAIQNITPNTPKLTVVFVVDQLASHYLTKLERNLSGGIKRFMDNGIIYTNAHQPLGKPSTAPGHVGMATGTVPAEHGIVDNQIREGGKEMASADVDIKTSTLTRHFLNASPHNRAYSIAYKRRSAVGLAGKDAPAIWFDRSTGKFTSSKQYFAATPNWMVQFNDNNKQLNKKQNCWTLAHQDKKYYDYPCIDNYKYSSRKTLFDPQNLLTKSKSQRAFLQQFMMTPDSSQVLLDLGYTAIQELFDNNPDAHVLMWISIANLDKVGHRFGPYARESIDTVYHIDQQIAQFMDKVAKVVPQDQTFYALTADHGIMPIPELLKQCYNSKAGQRIMIQDIKQLINNDIKQMFGVRNIVTALPAPYVYLNQEKLDQLTPKVQFKILGRIKETLESIPGVKKIHSVQDLCLQAWKNGSTKWLFTNQLYPRRNGHFVIEVGEGVLLAKQTTGTKHNSPQSYNLHVPLMLYHPQKSEKKIIGDKVWIPQLTRTLAHVLKIPAPHKAMKMLPTNAAHRSQTDLLYLY
ncbi:MAG TPA: alkaline phosphatase family protein [Candidatus Babeliales bacterium]|nr:alkaline phosphatase family protein [Candidatus Babeliales bacterium]